MKRYKVTIYYSHKDTKEVWVWADDRKAAASRAAELHPPKPCIQTLGNGTFHIYTVGVPMEVEEL